MRILPFSGFVDEYDSRSSHSHEDKVAEDECSVAASSRNDQKRAESHCRVSFSLRNM